MKLRTLLKRAHDIIKAEHDNVFDEFREDDGSITDENFANAAVLKRKYAAWLTDADRVLGPERPRTASARKKKAAYKIVVHK